MTRFGSGCTVEWEASSLIALVGGEAGMRSFGWLSSCYGLKKVVMGVLGRV